MAASNEPGPSRKRIATYGKAVRKRPPDHIAFKALEDLERPPMAPRPASVTSASRESSITDNSPSPFSTPPANFHIFDLPSSEDEASRTPQKKRKLVHVAVLEATSVKNTQNAAIERCVSEKVAEQGIGSKEFIHNVSMEYQHDPKRLSKPLQEVQPMPERSKLSGLLLAGMEPSMKIDQARPKNAEIRIGLSPRHSQKDSASSDRSAINSVSRNASQASKSQVDAFTTPRKTQAASTAKRPSRSSTPKAVDHVDREARDASTPIPGSSILTPKGMKMWNDLLGDDSDDDLEPKQAKRSIENLHYGVKKHRISSHNRRVPRRRLIDDLVEQSKNPRSLLDLYPDLEDVTLMKSIAPPFQAAEKQEKSTTQLASLQTSLEKVNTLGKTVGFGQSSQNLGSKITYSRQRSMLAEQDLTKEANFDIPLHEGVTSESLQNRRGSIPVLAPLHSLHENAEPGNEKAGVAIRTIHELRQAGAESRFKDEVEDLLDRIGRPAQQNTTRRSALMELAERMRDKLFYTKFTSNGIDQQLFLHLGQEQDIISGFILVSLLIPVLDAGITPMIVTQLRRQGITRLLIRLITANDSIITIAKARKSNMSKLALATLVEQHEAFLQLRVWGDLRPQEISPRTASLRCLELMVRQSREAGDTGDIISKELVSNLFKIFKSSYDNEAATTETVDFQLALSTLVSHSLNPMTGLEEFLPVVKEILEVTMQKPSEGPTVILLLRLVLNTTNNSPAASDAFASPELLHLMCRAVIEKFRMLSGFIIEDKRLVLVDHLVLILVVMINIAELSIRARQCFLAIQDGSLENLVMIFQDNIKRAFEADSVEDSHLNVAGGYLAVLLGCLSLSSEIGERIRMRQRTPSLQPLIAGIDEFISYHKKVDALLKDEGEHNPQAGLTDRLQALVDKLKEMSVL